MQQLAISADHKAACVGDQPERMPPLAGAFPGRTNQWAVPREDEAEGEVARIRPGAERIVDREQLDEPGSPIGGRRCCAVRTRAKPACHPLKAGSSGEPDGSALVAQDDEAIGAARRSGAQAQAQPCRAPGRDQMMFVGVAIVGEWFKAGRKRDRCYVGGLDHYHIGRCLR